MVSPSHACLVRKVIAGFLLILVVCLAAPSAALAAPVDLGDDSGGFLVQASPRQYPYTGNPVAPALVYVDDYDEAKRTRETPLVEGVDFEIAGYKQLVEDAWSGGVAASYWRDIQAAVDPGSYSVTVKGKGGYTGEATCGFSVGLFDVFSRVAGDNAYDTMELVARTGWSGAGTVVLATGENFPDALAAAGVAGLEGAPVLITKSSGGQLSDQASRELARLAPAKLIVVGGRFAMPDSVVGQARDASGAVEVVRLAGNKASDTAAAMNLEYAGEWSDTAFLATCKSFQDALSAAPLAYSMHMPIFLVDDMDTVSSATYEALSACGIDKLVVLGGRYCVSDTAKADLAAHHISVVGTLAGDSCYDTSYAIASWGLANGAGANHLGAATARNYPDALTGAALCGKNNSALVLVDDLSSTLPDWWGADGGGGGTSRGGRVRVGNGLWVSIGEYDRAEAQARKVENAKVCLQVVHKHGGGEIASAYVFGGRFAVSDAMFDDLNDAAAFPGV